ncbi:MAG: TonB-dependent receptor [Pseudomonadota bacterium]
MPKQRIAQAVAQASMEEAEVPQSEYSATESPAPAPELTAEQQAELEKLAGEGEVIEIREVTGSLVERRELTTPAPVIVLERTALRDSGLVNIGDILQNLPEQAGGINTQVNNGGDGSTRVDIRGLGATRTLVLLNGRRVVAGGIGADNSVDVSAIPLAMIERVEILKDGASAIYGSDAVSGVVNFITRNDFQGQEATVYTGASSRGDGLVYDLSFVTGAKGPKSNVVFSAGYSEQRSIMSGDRDWAAVDNDYDWIHDLQTDSGSTSTPGGFLVITNPNGNDAWANEVLAKCPSGACTREPLTRNPETGAVTLGEWRDFRFAPPDENTPNDFYNYQPENYLLTPGTRYNVFSTGNYSFHPMVRGFFEGMYMHRASEQKLAPEPLMGDVYKLAISKDSVYNPYGVDINFYRRRLTEVGHRIFSETVDTFRMVAGLEGRLGESGTLKNWKWDVSANYGRTQGERMNDGNLIRSRVALAIGPSFEDSNGVVHCGTVDAPGPANCVPLDLLGGVGTITPEMAEYLLFRGVAGGFNQQQTYLATARGPLFNTPWGGFAMMAVGGDYRDESGAYNPDPLTSTGDTTSNAVEPTSGDYHVSEGFGELSLVPIVGRGAAQWVELNAAARTFKYSTFGSGTTFKVGGLFRTHGGIAVRGTYSTAFRAPSIPELYSGNADSFPMGTDPCDETNGPIADPNVLEQCRAEGVPVGFKNPVLQIPTVVGGNPELQKETAKVLTAGIVFEPPTAKGLSLTVDYFAIDVDDAIDQLGSPIILSNCYGPDHTDCDKIHRMEGTNIIDYVDDKLTNVSAYATGGIDLAVRYNRNVKDIGALRFAFEGTYLLKSEKTDSGGQVWDAIGNHDLGVTPKFKGNTTLAWGRGPVDVGATMRYIGGIKECKAEDCNHFKASRYVDSSVTADVFASFKIGSRAGQTMLNLGVNNVLDQDPPVIYQAIQADSDASAYDYIGRFFYLRLSQLF